ncbi:DNA starvation/stationary phase protection protein [Thioclava sp. GXIMD2076]|uniref:DNA starvation/stationary phase protection protein n=1 Tax=Thioclava kandeliae TaxID=3070818 RepID=A0ABV1SCZ0_9RHOB
MDNVLQVKPKAEKVNTGVEGKKVMAKAVNQVASDVYKLAIKTQFYHWNVEGPLFRPLHLLTEEQYGELFESADVIAERVRALGELAPMNLKQLNAFSQLDELDGKPTAEEMIADLVKDHEAIAARIQDVIELADEHNDHATDDLLGGVAGQHEKMAWMLRSHLAK